MPQGIAIGNPEAKHCGALGERVYRRMSQHLSLVNIDDSARILRFPFSILHSASVPMKISIQMD